MLSNVFEQSEIFYCNPKDINFSQRTVSENVYKFIGDMHSGKWNWNRSGPLKIMKRGNHWVSYDNRRLLAAQMVGLSVVPVTEVRGKEWNDLFKNRFGSSKNRKAGGIVPDSGLKKQPKILKSQKK